MNTISHVTLKIKNCFQYYTCSELPFNDVNTKLEVGQGPLSRHGTSGGIGRQFRRVRLLLSKKKKKIIVIIIRGEIWFDFVKIQL